jgi:alanine dehydrogenase
MTGEIRILTRTDVVDLLPLDECVAAVESAFRLHAQGRSLGPGVLSLHARDGAFHIKAAGLELGRKYFAAKTNGNFFRNAERGLPRIQGTIVLCDAENGSPLAILDSIEITIRRTGAATAVAANYLARRDARTATIIGCGNQGRVSVAALSVVRSLDRVFAFDESSAAARAFVADISTELGIEAMAVPASRRRRSATCSTHWRPA